MKLGFGRWIGMGIFVVGGMGCAVVEKATNTVTTTVTTIGETVYKGDKKMGWYQTKREQPMYIMVARLSIPQANTEKVKEIGLQKYERVTWSGEQKAAPELVVNTSNGITALPGQCSGTMSIDGTKGGEKTVVLSMRYWWQTRENVKGRLVEDIEFTVGQPAIVDFDSGAVLKVDWKKVGT